MKEDCPGRWSVTLTAAKALGIPSQANTGMLRFRQHDLDVPNYDAYFGYKTVANLAREVFRIGHASVLLQKKRPPHLHFQGRRSGRVNISLNRPRQ